jgi:blue copper oxidase
MINRRQFLQITGAGAAGLVTGGMTSLLSVGEANAARRASKGFAPDLDLALHATANEISILPGNPTGVWQFEGQVLKGNPTTLTVLERSYLGPIIRAQTGQKVRIRFSNEIADPTIVHWHGLHVPADMDGHPRLVIPRGETYVYEFEVRNRAGT